MGLKLKNLYIVYLRECSIQTTPNDKITAMNVNTIMTYSSNTLQKEFGYFNHSFGHLSCRICQVVIPIIYALCFTMSNEIILLLLAFPLK